MPAVVVFLIDAVLVIIFAAIGRASHNEGLDIAGIAETGWPFLGALGLGWIVAHSWKRGAPRTVVEGLPVWAVTVAAGMLLRRATGEGTAVAFIIVATVTLAFLLLGWRFIARLIINKRTSSRASAA